MKPYLMYLLALPLLFITTSCDLTEDDITAAQNELAASVAAQVVSEAAIEQISNILVKQSNEFNPALFDNIVFTSGNPYDTFQIENVTDATATNNYKIKVSLNNQRSSADELNTIEVLSNTSDINEFFSENPKFEFLVDYTDADGLVVKMGENESSPLTIQGSRVNNVNQIAASGQISVSKTLSISNVDNPTNIVITIPSTEQIVIKNTIIETDGSPTSNASLCINDVPSGTADISGGIENLKTSTDANATTINYTASGKLNFDEGLGYINIPKTDATAATSHFCFYFKGAFDELDTTAASLLSKFNSTFESSTASISCQLNDNGVEQIKNLSNLARETSFIGCEAK